jgi:peptidoglycan/xylan/chitin deacetylase (PgdA/CDA1 family)
MPEMTVSPEMFDAQLRYLAKNYEILSLRDFLKLETKKHFLFSRPGILVTFDDGWRDNYLNAYPILKKHNVPAVIFLTTGYIGTTKVFWPERLANILGTILERKPCKAAVADAENLIEKTLGSDCVKDVIALANEDRSGNIVTKCFIEALKLLPVDRIEKFLTDLSLLLQADAKASKCVRMMLDWDHVQVMVKDGLEFGSHTRNHIILDRVEREEMRAEIEESKKDIEACTGISPKVFAYPNGNSSSETVEAVERAGYHAAFSTRCGLNWPKTSRYEIRRIRVDDNFSRGANGGFSPSLFEFGICRHILK